MVTKITRDELMAIISKGEKFKLVDVLDRDHYSKEHIKGAMSLPAADIEREAKKLLKKDNKIVVYCASFECQASTRSAEKLAAMGYKNVLDYKGGLKDYMQGNLPMEGSLYGSDMARTQKGCCSC